MFNTNFVIFLTFIKIITYYCLICYFIWNLMTIININYLFFFLLGNIIIIIRIIIIYFCFFFNRIWIKCTIIINIIRKNLILYFSCVWRIIISVIVIYCLKLVFSLIIYSTNINIIKFLICILKYITSTIIITYFGLFNNK